MKLKGLSKRRKYDRDLAIGVAARAMYIASSTNSDPGRDWDDMLNFPPQATTINHYRKLAMAALDAIKIFKMK